MSPSPGLLLRHSPLGRSLCRAATSSRAFSLLSSGSPSCFGVGTGHMPDTSSSISIDHGADLVKYLRTQLRNCDSVDWLKKLQILLIVNGLIEQEPLTGEIIRACFRLEDSELAVSLYRKVGEPTLDLQNLVLRCLADHGSYELVLSLYRESQVLGSVRSDRFTFPFIIKACAGLCLPWTGKEVHCKVLRSGYERNVVVETALVDMYGKTGSMKLAQRMFDEMPEKDLISWNALISGYSFNGLNEEALAVFQQICVSGFKPNVSTLVCVIPVCARIGAFELRRCICVQDIVRDVT